MKKQQMLFDKASSPKEGIYGFEIGKFRNVCMLYYKSVQKVAFENNCSIKLQTESLVKILEKYM